MENRLNIFRPEEPMDYKRRIKILRERKLEETRIKSKMKVYQDGDDYGSGGLQVSLPPEPRERLLVRL